jgi:hypothetical protein
MCHRLTSNFVAAASHFGDEPEETLECKELEVLNVSQVTLRIP